MDSSSSWIVVLAIYGAVVSTGLLVLRILEQVWVSVSTSFVPSSGTTPPEVVLRVGNRGRKTAQVTQLALSGHGSVSIPLEAELIVKGPKLPVKFDGLESESWHVDANELKKRLTETGWGYEVRGVATLDTGQRVWESIHRFTRVGQPER